jgi:osmotically-inducible protein OsmY
MNNAIHTHSIGILPLALFAALAAGFVAAVAAGPVGATMVATHCKAASGDGAVTSAVESRLLRNSLMDAGAIQVVTIEGVVELRGLAYSEAQKGLAGRLARDTYGVIGVNNQVDVSDWVPITEPAKAQARSRAEARQAAQVQSDPWITATVRSLLALSRGIGQCDIGVTTRAGVVSLRGAVASRVARDLAVELATQTPGVRAVEAGELIAF